MPDKPVYRAWFESLANPGERGTLRDVLQPGVLYRLGAGTQAQGLLDDVRAVQVAPELPGKVVIGPFIKTPVDMPAHVTVALGRGHVEPLRRPGCPLVVRALEDRQ